MSSGHISLSYEFQGIRKLIFIIILFFIFLHISFVKKIYLPINSSLFLFPFIICLIFSFYYFVRFNFYQSAGWLFATLIITLIWSLSRNQIFNFFKKYLLFSSILIFFGLVIVITTSFDSSNFNFSSPHRYSIFKLFANSDSFISTDPITQKRQYRFSFFLQQSSLVTVYLLLPLIIYSLIKRPSIYILIIYLLSFILSFSTTVYITIIIGIFVFVFFNFIRKKYKLIFFSFFVFSIILGLMFYLVFKMQSNYSSLGLDLNNYPFLRISSGAYRLEIIGNQTYHFFTKYFFGFFDNNNSIEKFLLGNLYISSGIRGGFVCAILFFFYILKIVKTILFNKNLNKFVSSMLISCLLVLSNLQDFGISSISGIVFLSLLSRLLFLEKNT